MDWQPLFGRLRAGWRVIGLTALVALVVAGTLAGRDDDRYRAAAVLAVTRPGARLEFDPRFRQADVDPTFPYRVPNLRTYAELARTSAVAAVVSERLAGSLPDAMVATDLRRHVRTGVLADGALITIQARATTPEAAARIANTWAEVFSAHMTALFGDTGGVESVVTARDAAGAALTTAGEALAVFDETSRLPALEAEVAELESRYAELLAARERLATAGRDIRLLAELPTGASGRATAARLASLALELGALAAPTDTLSVAVDLAAPDAGPAPSAAELAAVATAVERSRQAVVAAIGALPDELAAHRGALQREQLARAVLERDRVLAAERYLTLARRADELAAAAATERPEVRIAVRAVPPAKADYGHLVQSLLAALALGLVAGGLVVLILGSPPPPVGSLPQSVNPPLQPLDSPAHPPGAVLTQDGIGSAAAPPPPAADAPHH